MPDGTKWPSRRFRAISATRRRISLTESWGRPSLEIGDESRQGAQCGLTAKVKADGSFDRAKGRNVLQGHKGSMQKGRHYSVVFAPTPELSTNRLTQAIAVGDNYLRFCFDGDCFPARRFQD